MTNKYENKLIEQFELFDASNINIDHSVKKIFLCGGEVDIENQLTPSFRDRLLRYTSVSNEQLSYMHDSFVLAENFKDYFKENIYSDLLVFESDIASISALVLIVLESPGSLVELGMFCNKPELYKKLIIVANSNYTDKQDSFIYLGPLEYIRRKEPTAVAEYPWDEKVSKIDSDSLADLVSVINERLDKYPKTEKLKADNFGHLAFLTAEIISIVYPVLFGEIELVFMALEIEVSYSDLQRILYLLSKVGLISNRNYGTSYKFYYPYNTELRTARFGQNTKGKVLDHMKLRMLILQSFINESDQLSVRRKNVLKLINESKRGD